VEYDRNSPQTSVWVRLHNDGPGLAQDVVVARLEPVGRDVNEWQPLDRTPPVRALRSGENMAAELSLGTHTAGDDVFSIAVRWTDTAGQRWELIAPQDPSERIHSESRLRRRPWQRWARPPNW